MNKTDRKNKTDLTLAWPTSGGHFTIKDLQKLNPEFKEITLRVHVDRAKKDKVVSVIGSRNQGKGRPEMILAMTPVEQKLLDQAYNVDGIVPLDGKPLISISEVGSVPVSTRNPNVVSMNTESNLAPVTQAA
jgi:hypothetical protein